MQEILPQIFLALLTLFLGRGGIEMSRKLSVFNVKKTAHSDWRNIFSERKYSTDSPQEIFSPMGNMVKLYRKLARRYHPDLANGIKDMIEREKIMKEINKAYQDNDEAMLRIIATHVGFPAEH